MTTLLSILIQLFSCTDIQYQQEIQHDATAVGVSRERQIQYETYRKGTEEGKTLDSISTVERHVKQVIYPRVKFLSDDEDEYLQPDFAEGTRGKQAVAICERILRATGKDNYTTKQKVEWWVAYRKVIRKRLCKLRQSNVRYLQIRFVEGKLLILV